MTPVEAAKAVALLAAAYPAARWSEQTGQIYEQMLADLDFEVAKQAVMRLVCTSKFLPTIAELREAAGDIVLGPCRNGIDAWGDVTMAIRRVGSYGTPTFKDSLVGECVRIMGWRYLCLAETSEAADRARFAELYTDLQRRQRTANLSEPGRLLPEGRREQRSTPKELAARNAVVELADWIGRPQEAAAKTASAHPGREKSRP